MKFKSRLKFYKNDVVVTSLVGRKYRSGFYIKKLVSIKFYFFLEERPREDYRWRKYCNFSLDLLCGSPATLK